HWSPDGRRLASTGDGLVRIWDAETGQETARIAHEARSVAWSPDGTRIASGGDGLEVHVWNAREGRLDKPVLTQPAVVRWLSWSPDSRRLASVSLEHDQATRGEGLSIWDIATGARVLRVGQRRDLRSVAFSPDGSRLAAGGAEGIVRVFDAADGRDHAALFTGCMMVTGLAFSPDGRRLYAGGWGVGGGEGYGPAPGPRGRGL